MIVVRLLFFPSTMSELHLPISDGSLLFPMIDDESSFAVTVAVSSGLQSEFHAVFCFRRAISNFIV